MSKVWKEVNISQKKLGILETNSILREEMSLEIVIFHKDKNHQIYQEGMKSSVHMDFQYNFWDLRDDFG